MRKLILVTMVLGALAASAAKVASVSVKTEDGEEQTGDVVARCQVKAGDEYDPQQCARDVRALRDAGEFDEITLKADPAAHHQLISRIWFHLAEADSVLAPPSPLKVKLCSPD